MNTESVEAQLARIDERLGGIKEALDELRSERSDHELRIRSLEGSRNRIVGLCVGVSAVLSVAVTSIFWALAR